MGISKEILAVERPKNTVVCDSKIDGPNRYYVRGRSGYVYVKGRNPMPVNGATIGHIIDGKYVPLVPRAGSNGEDMKSYGSSVFAYSLSNDILEDLMKVYSPSDSYSIMAAASLKVIKPHIASNRMDTHYHLTFVSEFYPGSYLSKNSMTDLYKRLGMDEEKMKSFFKLRMERVLSTHRVIIDSTLKLNISTENDLSAFSYKAKLKGSQEIAVMYIYDFDTREPIASAAFPGNSVDSVSYNEFVEKCNITKGIIVDDKGFPPSKIREYLKSHPQLHYLTPIKRTDKRIKTHNLLEFDGVVSNIKENVVCKKVKVSEGMFLYAFKDSYMEYNEQKTYIERTVKQKSFSAQKYSAKQNVFGVIVFESDMDITTTEAYQCYQSRWDLEVLFKYYKSDLGLTTTNVQSDFAVMGEEFVNLLSSIITSRIVKKASEKGLLEKMTYENLMDDLSTAWRRTDYQGKPSDKPKSNGPGWVHTLPKVKKLLELLELSIPEVLEKKKRGRPKKISTIEKPKRPVGRPKKQKDNINEPNVTQVPKKRGRPRKNKV